MKKFTVSLLDGCTLYLGYFWNTGKNYFRQVEKNGTPGSVEEITKDTFLSALECHRKHPSVIA